ncbi:MAG TPA: hypothetical protein VFE32_17290 [Puia sp.]|jgi:hypothetical protein|nr:hypothetical protein [Puia sp.]
MVIEVLVRGEVLLRARIAPELMKRDRRIPLRDEHEYRQKQIQGMVAILEREIDRLLIPGDQVSFCLTVPSKMEDDEAPFF